MIDVLLVLLVFFVMITSAEVLKVDKKITLPVSPNAKPKDKDMAKHEYAINIRWQDEKGVLVMDDVEYHNWDDAKPKLEAAKKNDELLRVVVRGDRNLPAEEIQKVMNLIASCGISNIAFSASNK